MTKAAFGLNYLLNNMESNITYLHIIIERDFGISVDEFIDTYFKEDEEGFYITI